MSSGKSGRDRANPDADLGLAWTAFYPNAVWQPGHATNALLSAAARAKWVAEVVYEDDWSQSFETAQKRAFARARAMAEILGLER